MKKIKLLLFAAMLLAAPVSRLSARTTAVPMVTEETLSDATVQQVLEAAALQIGESYSSLNSLHQAGTLTIIDLGPVRDGRLYRLSRTDTDWVTDIVVNG